MANEEFDELRKTIAEFNSRSNFAEFLQELGCRFGNENVVRVMIDTMQNAFEYVNEIDSRINVKISQMIQEHIARRYEKYGERMIETFRDAPSILNMIIYNMIEELKRILGDEMKSQPDDIRAADLLLKHLEEALKVIHEEKGVSLALLKLFFENAIVINDGTFHLDREGFITYLKQTR